MSPEQAASEPVDGRSDIYSLGVVGYLAVSGRLPFESSNLPALLVRQATEAPPSVMSRRARTAARARRGDRPMSRARSRRADSPTARRWPRRSSRRWRRVPRCHRRCARGSARSNPRRLVYIGCVRLVQLLTSGTSPTCIDNGNLWTIKQRLDVADPRDARDGSAAAHRRLPPESGAPALPRRAHARRPPHRTR